METKRLVLCDTDVLIRLFRRDASIEEIINRYGEKRFVLSSITAAGIYFGMKRKQLLADHPDLKREDLQACLQFTIPCDAYQ